MRTHELIKIRNITIEILKAYGMLFAFAFLINRGLDRRTAKRVIQSCINRANILEE